MKKIFWGILFLVVVMGVGWWQRANIPILRGWFHPQSLSTKYTCPMHPQIIRDKPGTCPICGMTLQPMVSNPEEMESHEKHKGHEGSFLLSPWRRQAIGIKTAEVVQKVIHQEVRLPGRVAFDQELYVTETEYVEGLKWGGSADVMKTIETKLKRLGLSNEEFKNLKKNRAPDTSLFLPKEGGPIWVYVSVYESDFSWVTPGMEAQITLPADSSLSLKGVVKQVAPIVDSVTRTAKARILVSSLSKSLKPETYVNVILKKDLGEALAVPSSAILSTGTRQVAFVDLEGGILEPREVKLGPKAGSDYPVLEGLNAGEKVIVSAHFLLDSESQIQAALKKFGEAQTGGHQH